MANPPSKRADQLGFRPKRFWRDVAVADVTTGFAVNLDGRPIKTPAGETVVLPNGKLAQSVAHEWSAVGEHLDYEDMPLTRLAFAAIDRMPAVQAETVAEVRRYSETDLLCYPSEYPQALTERENAVWAPLLAWASNALELDFEPNRSLMHRPQPPATLDRIAALVAAMTPFEQAGLMAAIPLLGSVVLALALWRGRLTGEAAFAASRIGEDFQAETWGRDAEAAARAETMKKQASSLELWFDALRDNLPKA